MIYTICISSILFLVFLVVLIYINQLSNIENYDVKIYESSKSINILHEQQMEILTKLSKLFQKQIEEKIFKDLPKIKNKSLNTFELDLKINELGKELKEILEYKRVSLDETNEKLISSYNNNKIELDSLKLYYNNSVNKYNKTIKSIKYLLVKALKKLNSKDVYTIENEVEFEILKK